MNKTIRVLKQPTVCLDKASKLEGTVTHCIIKMDGSDTYLFQPKGLSSDGDPLNLFIVVKERLEVTDDDFENIDVPFEILGTKVTDKVSGFTGMAIDFVRHINGCFHVSIQPTGFTPGGQPVKDRDFDLRGCEGEKITELSEIELKKSKESRPSPTGDKIPSEMPGSMRS